MDCSRFSRTSFVTCQLHYRGSRHFEWHKLAGISLPLLLSCGDHGHLQNLRRASELVKLTFDSSKAYCWTSGLALMSPRGSTAVMACGWASNMLLPHLFHKADDQTPSRPDHILS